MGYTNLMIKMIFLKFSNVRNTRPGDKKYDDTSTSTTSSTSFHSARNGELGDGEATERNNVNENVRSNGESNNGNDDIPPNIRELQRRLQVITYFVFHMRWTFIEPNKY